MVISNKVENAPTVSVIIPAYNQARYISEAIQSLLNQTYPYFEAVIVNDGSTDETPSLLAEIHDPRFRVISQPNSGLSAARNTALRESSAALVTLLDADDFFLPDKLSILVSFLNDHSEIGMVSGGTILVDQESKPFHQTIKTPDSIQIPELLFGNPFVPSSVVIRRSWFETVGLFDETLRACEDWDLLLRMASAGCQFAWVEQPVAAYRFHLGQMTRDSDRMRNAIIKTLGKFYDQTGLPSSITDLKNRVFATGLVHAAVYAYNANEFEKGKADLDEAIRMDPTLRESNYLRLIGLLSGWSNDPRSGDPEEFLQKFIKNPPPGQPDLRRQLRRAMADNLLGSLFSQKNQGLTTRRRDLLKVIQYKPEWIFNRGVIRMFVDAWIRS